MRLSVAMLVTLLVASAARGESPRSSQTKDLLGTRAKEWAAGPEWANSKPLELRDLRGRVVVVRFWTDTCDYCAASLPAMQKLADEFRDAPVTFVGLYHSKPYGSEKPWEVAVAKAKELGVRFPIAYDHSWKTVSNWWLKGGSRAATSSTFIIGPDGKIAFVHPGPVFFPGSDPSHARANADYEAIRAAIRTTSCPSNACTQNDGHRQIKTYDNSP